MGEGKLIRDTAEAVEGLAKAVPVYQDVLQPAAKEVGEALRGAVHVALAPIRGLVWGWAQIEDHFLPELVERLRRVPPERIITPSTHVAGPALEAMRFTGAEPSLRELYAHLLATAMDRETASRAHPAFVEVIRQLTPDEAKLLKHLTTVKYRPVIGLYAASKDGSGERLYHPHLSLLGIDAGCQYTRNTTPYIENLCRLGLTIIPITQEYADETVYEQLETDPIFLDMKRRIEAADRVPRIERQILAFTTFGRQFVMACIAEGVEPTHP